MIGRLTFIAALLTAPLALAQEATLPSERATPEQVEAARAEADRIIAAAGAGDLFANITGNSFPTVRHRTSGLICHFRGSPEVDRILIFPNSPRGDDVGCTTRDANIWVETTYYATRYTPMPTEAAILDDAMAAIRNRFPSARPFEGELSSASTDGVTPVSAALVVETNMGTLFTMATVEHQDGWSFKARTTGPLEKAEQVNLSALRFTCSAFSRGPVVRALKLQPSWCSTVAMVNRVPMLVSTTSAALTGVTPSVLAELNSPSKGRALGKRLRIAAMASSRIAASVGIGVYRVA